MQISVFALIKGLRLLEALPDIIWTCERLNVLTTTSFEESVSVSLGH